MRTLRVIGLLAFALAGCTNALVDDVPRLYACDRAQGLNSCPGGWRCGLSGFCQDPAQALPYACESAADCSSTWNCGAERLCYDRNAAQDRACRASLETIPDAGDCAPGWRCGRELRGQVCHPVDAGAAYLCTSDSDCEASWRCGPEGACVDVATQGLRPGEVTLSLAKASPLLPGPVDLLQLNVFPSDDLVGSWINRLTFVADGQLTLVTNSASEVGPYASSRHSTPLLRPGHALAQTEAHLLVTDSTGLVDYRDALDGGVAVLVGPALANAELRYAQAEPSPVTAQEELAAFAGSTIGLCGRGTSSVATCDPATLTAVTIPATVNDVTFIDELNDRRSALAATSAGPYLAPRSLSGAGFLGLDGGSSLSPVWRRVSLPGLSGGCTGTPTPLDRLTYEPRSRLLTVTTDQDRRLSVFTRPYSPQNTSECAQLAFEPQYGPCSVCGPGEVLLQVGAENPSQVSTSVLALCRRAGADAGSLVVGYRHDSIDGGCGLAPVDLPLAVSLGYQAARQTAGLQGLDSVGNPRGCPVTGCPTMLFSKAPERAAGGPGMLAAYNDDVIDVTLGPQVQSSALSSPLGLRIVRYQNLYVAGSVTERPDWMISSLGRSGTQGDQTLALMPMSRKHTADLADPVSPYALFSRSSDLLPSAGSVGDLIDASGTRSFSTLTTDAEGQPWLIVGAADRIWADARPIAEDAGIRTIGIKAAPLPSAEIQSLAFAAFDRADAGSGPLLDGYTVEQQRLFRVLVHTPALWLTDEIRLGVTNTLPLAVWMEGSRGRVGTSDGRVFGLPVPVVLSTTIPEAPLPTVLNYGSLCGQAFALSPTALYRLTLEAPPLGTWKRVSLEPAQAGLDGFGPHWSAVVHKAREGNQEHLYLFSQTGLVVDVSATCP